ncbi:MAG: hypothetical protein V1779_11285 [bacterium]
MEDLNIVTNELNVDNDYLSQVSDRLKSFVKICYKNNFARFSKVSGIKESTLSRLKSGEDTSISMLSKVENAGLSLPWLVNLNNDIKDMFANNVIGNALKELINKVISIENFTIYDKKIGQRAKFWINRNFGNVENLIDTADFWNYDKSSLRNIINKYELPDTRFVNFMKFVGCPEDFLLDETVFKSSERWGNPIPKQKNKIAVLNQTDSYDGHNEDEIPNDELELKPKSPKETFDELLNLADKMKSQLNALRDEF